MTNELLNMKSINLDQNDRLLFKYWWK